MRAGGYALSLLSVPLNVDVLQTLAEEPTPLIDLRRAVGSPPQTTMRGNLKALTEIGVLERRRHSVFPGSVDYEIAGPGRDLLAVVEILRSWLHAAPDGPREIGTVAAKSTIKALVDGWSTAIVRALAARPLALTELNRLISSLSYPSLERRVGAMRLAGLIDSLPNQSRGRPYAVTEWMRLAIAPLAASARWEHQHVPTETPPIGRVDVEAAFLLALPILDLAEELSGSCRLAVEVRNGAGGNDLAGVLVGVRDGQIVSCVSRLEGDASAWAAGSAATWLRAVIGREIDRLEVGGDCSLALALVDGLHGALFGVRQRA